jgi:superfamily II DNA helicase RecQ
MSVPYETYRPGIALSGQKKLILCSLDQTRKPHWSTQMAILEAEYGVERFIFDEGQMAYTALFRDVFKDLYQMRVVKNAQFVVLSGSATITSEAYLANAFGLQDGWECVRTRTVRPELQFLVRKPVKDEQNVVVETIRLAKDEMMSMLQADNDRGLIFVRTIQDGKEIAASLNCPFYHGSLIDKQRKDAISKLQSGAARILVATNAYIAGNDYPAFRFIIWCGIPCSFDDFGQGSGRGGRDGRLCRVHIIYPLNPKFPQQNKHDPDDLSGTHMIFDFFYPPLQQSWPGICIRYRYHFFVEGIRVTCLHSPKFEKCLACMDYLRKKPNCKSLASLL